MPDALDGASSQAHTPYASHSQNSFQVEELQRNPDVDYIEQDTLLKLLGTQSDASWNLARLSNAQPGSTTYTFDDSAGEGTCAYVIDTGVDVQHPDFEGRAQIVANLIDEDASDTTDVDGHGTHVAGIIGSKTYGVAKKTQLLGIKLANANGVPASGLLSGLEFVANDAPTRPCPRGIVVNISIDGRGAVREAMAGLAMRDIFVAVAAGNFGYDAELDSVASEPSACVVGSTDENDSMATFSNTGRFLDLLAPGVDILSTWPDGGTNVLSGTSMAAPHVAGLGAYLLGMGESAQGLCARLQELALAGVIKDIRGDTVNLLANNGNKNSPGGDNPQQGNDNIVSPANPQQGSDPGPGDNIIFPGDPQLENPQRDDENLTLPENPQQGGEDIIQPRLF